MSRIACMSNASAIGSPVRDTSPSMAIANVLRLALTMRSRGADEMSSGWMKIAWARVFGSKSARRSPVAGSKTAAPAFTIAVVGVVGTINCGSLGASSLGLRSWPLASRDVHRLLGSLFSAARMLPARAVTIDEPPPRATTASASRRFNLLRGGLDRGDRTVRDHAFEDAGAPLAHSRLHRVEHRAPRPRPAEDHRAAAVQALELAPEKLHAVGTAEQTQRRRDVLERTHVLPPLGHRLGLRALLRELGAHLRTDDGLVDLAGGVGRQRLLLDSPEARNGKRRDIALQLFSQLRTGEVAFGHDDGHHFLAEVGVRNAEHDGLVHAGNRHQRALDGGRRDVLAAADDHVLAAPGDPQVALVVQAAEIAGVQPAFGVDGRLVEAVVAGHLRRRAQQDLAVGQAGMREELDLDQRHRPAGRAQHLHFFRAGRAGGLAAVLRQPIARRNARTDAWQCRAHALHQLRMHRRAADADRLQAAQLPARDVRVIEQPRDHGRHRGPAIDLVALDQFQHLGGIVLAALHDQRVADDHGAQQRLHLADVKQRAR